MEVTPATLVCIENFYCFKVSTLEKTGHSFGRSFLRYAHRSNWPTSVIFFFFSLYVEIHSHQPNSVSFSLPFTSINPFYIRFCLKFSWFLYSIAVKSEGRRRRGHRNSSFNSSGIKVKLHVGSPQKTHA